MHRTGKTIIYRVKTIVQAIRTTVAFSPWPGSSTRKRHRNPSPSSVSPTSGIYAPPIRHAADTDTTLTGTDADLQHTPGLLADDDARGRRGSGAACRGRDYRQEVYLPGPVWDALNPTERFASVADLCAHVGDQLPVQVVKLVARDVLRELVYLQHTRGTVGHQNITQNTILLSPTDLRALICQLRADTPTSLRPSELAISTAASGPQDGGLFIPEAGAVFTLADPDRQDRLKYIEDQALQPPEALLGAPRGTSGDIWTLGCVVFELLTGETLFDPAFQTRELAISREESHIIQMIEVFGAIPVDLIRSGTLSGRWFTDGGALRIETSYYPTTLQFLLERRLGKDEVPGATAFLESLLKIHPEDRARPEGVIDHHWFAE